MIWFISDLHFNHINLIRDARNTSPEIHDELIIKNWNSVVNKKRQSIYTRRYNYGKT